MILLINNSENNLFKTTWNLKAFYVIRELIGTSNSVLVNSKDENYTVDHSGSLVLINPEGEYAGFFRAPHNQNKVLMALDSLLN